MRQLIAGNWKMNGLTMQAATLVGPLHDAAAGLGCDLLVCPPFTQVIAVAQVLSGPRSRWAARTATPRRTVHTPGISRRRCCVMLARPG